jgi:hypothetical protein
MHPGVYQQIENDYRGGGSQTRADLVLNKRVE